MSCSGDDYGYINIGGYCGGRSYEIHRSSNCGSTEYYIDIPSGCGSTRVSLERTSDCGGGDFALSESGCGGRFVSVMDYVEKKRSNSNKPKNKKHSIQQTKTSQEQIDEEMARKYSSNISELIDD